jgi:hypothetical protein
MPEFIHSFQRGRMNKDLDERLIPNGEYRDALNLDLANSDGSNVGTLQNIKGNIELRGKVGSSTGWDTKYIDGLNGPRCIGTIRDDKNERIYWFIAAQGVSAIAEYDQKSNKVIPVLVDTENILNFSTTYLITGINIIDKFLFWTDDQTEPKKINIEKFKAGTKNFLTHTKIPLWNPSTNTYSTNISQRPDMVEADITVIKKSPLSAPGLSTSSSKYGEQIFGVGTLPIITLAIDPVFNTPTSAPNTPNFTYRPDTTTAEYETLPTYGEFLYNIESDANYYDGSDLEGWDGVVTLTFQTPWGEDENGNSVWNTDDIIKLSAEHTEYLTEYNYEVFIKIDSANGNIVTGKIQSITPDIRRFVNSNGSPYYLEWETLLVEEDPMFEYKFPRFAYRWKYIDNEYSCFSPFSEVAFVGSEFKYKAADGYNVGMTNNLRKLIVKSIDWATDEVAEVDILYKESNNTTVYVVETLKRKDYQSPLTLPTYFQLKSEIISKVVESNQLLRPWDNVPRKAKAQEIVGNRLLYGNYLQNYNTEKVDLSVGLQSDLHLSNQTTVGGSNDNPYIRIPQASLKSLRNYQAGIIFKDQYGRETPVITTKDASVRIPISNSKNANKLIITPSGTAPSWATHYKFFVKEISNEYYNLALDKFYYAEDGNIWLSFPSSERNKLDIETYLILKKQHANDTAVIQTNKYKILAIENEPPDFIASFYRSIAYASVTIRGGFIENSSFLEFDGPKPEGKFAESITSKNYIEIYKGGSSTLKYKIKGGGATGNDGIDSSKLDYDIELEESLNADADFLAAFGGGDEVKIRVYSKEVESSEEFEGRFFVKINRDAILDAELISPFRREEEIYEVKHEVSFQAALTPDPRNSATNYEAKIAKGFYYGDYGAKKELDWKVLGIQPWGGIGTDTDAWINDLTRGTQPGVDPDVGYRPPQRGNKWFGVCWVNPGVGENNPLFGTPSDAQNGDGQWTEDQLSLIDSKLIPGNKIRFKNTNTNEVSQIYTIVEAYLDTTRRGYQGLDNDPSNRRAVYQIKLSEQISESWFPEAGTGDWNKLQNNLPSIQLVDLVFNDDNKKLTSSNPTIFETEPKENIDLDIFNEASDALPINTYGQPQTLYQYFNCYSFGNGVESNRIRDDFNAPTIDKGPKVSAPLDEPYTEERRGSGMIFSQIFNSTSGINRLNQFIQAEPITKDLNPIYGTIQKLHVRDTDAIVLCEDKCLRVLANKDALYNADGNVNITSNQAVLGQAVPYAGEYGISKNPESFASFGFRTYFTDKNRGAVIRLSMDGITDLASKGMSDFFADNFRLTQQLIGNYDEDKGIYNLTLQNMTPEWRNELSTNKDYHIKGDCTTITTPKGGTTVSFKEEVDGWTSRKSFIPEGGISLNNIYYTFKNGLLWEHGANTLANNFYGTQHSSHFNVIVNEMPQVVKLFSTVNYTGTKSRFFKYLYNGKWYNIDEINELSVIPTDIKEDKTGWFVNYVKTDMDAGEVKEFDKKEGKYFNYIKSLETCKTIGGPIGGPSDPTNDDQDYILTVTIDPDCSSESDPVAEALLSLEFVGTYYTATSVSAYTWTNPDGSGESVNISARTNLGHHLCNRGTYRIVANSHVNGGFVVGRLYMGNMGGISTGAKPLYDTYTTDTNGYATSPTGDVESGLIASANEQGNIDSLGNVKSVIYRSNDTTNWGTNPANSKQRYIGPAIPYNSQNRYSLVKITPEAAAEVAANYQDPANPNYVTFTLQQDTYTAGGVLNTHNSALWFQVFKLGNTTTEIYADDLGATLNPSVTFNVLTGEQIP